MKKSNVGKYIETHVSVHSEDIDIFLNPNSSEFSLHTPENMNEICGIQMKHIILPHVQTFSKMYNNTQIQLNNETLNVPQGSYSPEQFVCMLRYRLKNIDPSYEIFYNDVSKKISILNTNDSFVFYSKYRENHQSTAFWGLGYNLGMSYKDKSCSSIIQSKSDIYELFSYLDMSSSKYNKLDTYLINYNNILQNHC